MSGLQIWICEVSVMRLTMVDLLGWVGKSDDGSVGEIPVLFVGVMRLTIRGYVIATTVIF